MAEMSQQSTWNSIRTSAVFFGSMFASRCIGRHSQEAQLYLFIGEAGSRRVDHTFNASMTSWKEAPNHSHGKLKFLNVNSPAGNGNSLAAVKTDATGTVTAEMAVNKSM